MTQRRRHHPVLRGQRAFGWGFGRLIATAAAIGTVGIIIIMAITVANVVARRVFNSSVTSSVEISQQLLVMSAFLGFAYAQRRGAHIATRVVTARLSPWTRVGVRMFGLLATLVLSAWMTWGAYEAAKLSVEINEQIPSVVNFPAWPARVAIAIGFVLLTCELVRSIAVLAYRGRSAETTTFASEQVEVEVL